jgi:DNA-binding NtrC family response regulator
LSRKRRQSCKSISYIKIITGTIADRLLDAANVVEALSTCEQSEGPIHLLVTDIVMPRMSGRETANRLAALRPEIKVLCMSEYTNGAIIHHGMLDADTPFIQKPFAPDALARKVREVLDS